MTANTEAFRSARDALLSVRTDYDAARAQFAWPRFEQYNFATDWFDAVASGERADTPALIIAEQDGTTASYTWAQLADRSKQVARWLADQGVKRGDHAILMLGNQVELWETMLAGIRMGLVMIPTTTLMGHDDLLDRVERGGAQWVVVGGEHAAKFSTVPGDFTLITVRASSEQNGAAAVAPQGQRAVLAYEDAASAPAEFEIDSPTLADETLLLYFTSGTTSKAKLVEHTHTSYPVGHLSTMYWIGLEPGDVHLNVASPGWAKHAWSNFFTPWIAEATVFIYNYERFDALALMEQMDAHGVTSFCAPPTVWRMLIQADLTHLKHPPVKVVAAGEPLNAEIIDRVQKAWGATIRDGFGQSESTVQVANTPGSPIRIGSMGRPLPGYEAVIIDPATGEEAPEGELCLRLDPRPVGLMKGYYGNAEKTAEAFRDGVYHTGDTVMRDENGVITYVGRADDVFKSSDYRLSPFELESVLIEHPLVAEAAVVPSPDPLKLSVPKAYVVLVAGAEPSQENAQEIMAFSRTRLAPFKRIRRLEFAELPKTISGKIRRVELRRHEAERHGAFGEGGTGQGLGIEYEENISKP